MIHYKIVPQDKDRATGAVTVRTGEERTVPASLGRKLIAEGSWQLVEEVEMEDSSVKAKGDVKPTTPDSTVRPVESPSASRAARSRKHLPSKQG